MHTYYSALRILCEAFQLDTDGVDFRCEQRLIEEAHRLNHAYKTVVPIIDDAHLLDMKSLRRLRLMLEDFPKNHNLILLEQPALLHTLSLTVNDDIRSRLTYSVLLRKLAPDDMQHFIVEQLDRVALAHSTFSDDALQLIIRSSEGILRYARNLCLSALLEAVRDRVRTVGLKPNRSIGSFCSHTGGAKPSTSERKMDARISAAAVVNRKRIATVAAVFFSREPPPEELDGLQSQHTRRQFNVVYLALTTPLDTFYDVTPAISQNLYDFKSAILYDIKSAANTYRPHRPSRRGPHHRGRQLSASRGQSLFLQAADITPPKDLQIGRARFLRFHVLSNTPFAHAIWRPKRHSRFEECEPLA